MTSNSVEPLRLSITLPGAASLGAYQSGAAAAIAVLIRSLRRQGRTVHVDAVGGASAGSIVGMLVCHCLLAGRDAPSMLSDAWVDEVDLELLRCGGHEAPLAFDDLRERLCSFLADTDEHPVHVHEPLTNGVTFDVGLTSLLGFTQPIEAAGGGRTSTLNYADWLRYELSPEPGHLQLVEPSGSSVLDAVLVSASHPGALAPKLISHRAHSDKERKRTVANVEPGDALWYTDGGLVESRPISRVVRAARERSGDDAGARIHMLIDPRSSGPSGNERWADPHENKSWIDGVRRSLSVLPTQALHDDLRSIAVTNDQLRVLDRITADLTSKLSAASQPVDVDDLRSDLAKIGDLVGKEHVDVEMISPLLLADDDDQGVNDLLAGDFIGAFGGFIDRRIRRSDYALGWSAATTWVKNALPRYDVDQEEIDQVLADIDDATRDRWSDAVIEGDAVKQLDAGGRWQLALLALQIARVVVAEAAPSPISTLRNWKSSR